MADRKTQGIDLLNQPVLMAAEQAFRQLEAFMAELPNPPGQVAPGDTPARVPFTELDRLTRGG